MTVGIYGIFDAKTDECLYVGKSITIESRWKKHIYLLRTGKHIRSEFVDWFNEHNKDPESMRFAILEECDNKGATKNLLEIKWFNELRPKFFRKLPSVKDKWQHTTATKIAIGEAMLKRSGSTNTFRDSEGFLFYRLTCESCAIGYSSRNYRSKTCSQTCEQKLTKNKAYGDLPLNSFSDEDLLEMRDRKMTYPEISQLTGGSVGAVYKRIADASKNLQI